MTPIFLAPPLDDYRSHALDSVDAHFASRARPTFLQSMDALKIAEAKTVAAGIQGQAPLLEAEADLKGVTVDVIAEQVLTKAGQSAQYELDRLTLKTKIRLAESHAEIAGILSTHHVQLIARGRIA